MLKKCLTVVIWSPARTQALAVDYYLVYFQMAVDISPLPNAYKNLLRDKKRAGSMSECADNNTSTGEYE